MMRTICLLLPLLLVFPAVSEGAQGLRNVIYRYSDRMMNWTEARTFCRKAHTDLVTINSAEENLNLSNEKGWIGLYREGSNKVWNWSRRGEVAKFTNWKSDHPKEDHNCAFKHFHEDKWDSARCGVPHSVICYDERLVLVKRKRTWENALRYCRALEAVDSSKPATFHQNHRYDLATLLTPDDRAYAWWKAQGANTDEVWTGWRYLDGQWLWVGGEAPGSSDIQSCASQRFCGVLVKNNSTVFETRECDERRNFLCYKRVE